jgi:hypothetical protein
MTEPVGATISNIGSDVEATWNEGLEPAGGRPETWAGMAVDIEVSDNSLVNPPVAEIHLTEQVATAPCDAGGVQMEIRWSLTADARVAMVVFVTVPMPPNA